MKLLVTGAARFDKEQLNMLSSLGIETVFQHDECAEPETDFSSVDAVICNGLFLYHGIDEFNNLKFVQLTSAGLDRVPVDRIKEKGIVLKNARGVYSVPMAEYAVAGVLELFKGLNGFYKNQKNHLWIKNRELRDLSSSTVAVIGFGNVGYECAKRFKSFDTRIIGVDVFKNDNPCDEFYLIKDIKTALNKADIVVLTLPLTDETKGMFNRDLFCEFKENSVLVNISRGAVINETHLIEALERGKLGGAVLDVFEKEPLDENSKLWDFDNVIITPHNSFVSPSNSKRLFDVVYKNLKDYLKGDK